MKKYIEIFKQLNILRQEINDDREIIQDNRKNQTESFDFASYQERISSNREKVLKIQFELEVIENKRIKKEERRLNKIFKDYTSVSLAIVEKLIARASFMFVQLENYEHDIKINGSTELFSQGEQQPYERARPVVQQYATMNGNYQKTLKQLTDLLPDDEQGNPLISIIHGLSKPTQKL